MFNLALWFITIIYLNMGFFRNVHLYLCKIVDQEQEFLNFDRFIGTQFRSSYKYSFFAQEG